MTIERLSTTLVPIAFVAIAGLLASKGYLAHYGVLICFGLIAFLVMWAWRRYLLSSLPTDYKKRISESTAKKRVEIGRALAAMIVFTLIVPLATVALMYLLPNRSESWKTFSICMLLIGLASKIPLGVLITEWYLFRSA